MVKELLSQITKYDKPKTNIKTRCCPSLLVTKNIKNQLENQDHFSLKSEIPFPLQNNDLYEATFHNMNYSFAEESHSVKGSQLPKKSSLYNHFTSPTTKFSCLENHVRQNIINCCQTLCRDWEFTKQTFFLSAAYIDLIANDYSLITANWSLLSSVCVYLAAKLHENSRKLPSLKKFIKSISLLVEPSEYAIYEAFIVELLDFNLDIKTPFIWFENLTNHSEENCTKTNCFCNNQDFDFGSLQKMDQKLKKLSLLLIHLCLKFWDFHRFDAKTIAVACIITVMNAEFQANRERNLPNLSIEPLRECLKSIQRRLKIRKLNSFKDSRKTVAKAAESQLKKNLIRDSFSTCDSVNGKLDCQMNFMKKAEKSLSVEAIDQKLDFNEEEFRSVEENNPKFKALFAKVVSKNQKCGLTFNRT